MDQPGLEAERHEVALQGLARINWVSRSDAILWRPIRKLATELNGRPLRVLDIATGGGDVPIRLWHRAKRAGLALQIAGADISATAVDHAQRQAKRAGAEVEFFRFDVFHAALPKDFDVVTSSLFLHHLEEEQAVDLLRRMGQAARRLVLINDLIRSRIGFALAWMGTRSLSTSRIVHVDGPRSVEGAFTMTEARVLAEKAGAKDLHVSWRWPYRFLLEWRTTS